jgi:alkylhydroperoxidase family enzyme
MRKQLATLGLKQFAKRYDYDVSYMEHMLEAAPKAFEKFAKVSDITRHRETAPAEAHAATGLVGALKEDCGPCVQLGVQMAEEAGVAPEQIAAILTRDLDTMTVNVRAAFCFADALVREDASLDEAREEVRRLWGDAGVIELTLVAQAVRLYPMVKRGLGYAKLCQRVQVGGQPVDVVKDAA